MDTEADTAEDKTFTEDIIRENPTETYGETKLIGVSSNDGHSVNGEEMQFAKKTESLLEDAPKYEIDTDAATRYAHDYPTSNSLKHEADSSQSGQDGTDSVSTSYNESENFMSGESDLARQYAEYLANCKNEDSALSSQYEESLVNQEQDNKNLDLSKQYEEYLANRKELNENAAFSNQYEEHLVSREQFNKPVDLSKQYAEYLANCKNENSALSNQYEEPLASQEQLNKNLDLSKQYEEYLANRKELNENSDLSNQYEEHEDSQEQLNKPVDLSKQYAEYSANHELSGKNLETSKQHEEYLANHELLFKNSDLSKQYEEYLANHEQLGKNSDLSKQHGEYLVSQEQFGKNADLSKQYEEYMASKRYQDREEYESLSDKAGEGGVSENDSCPNKGNEDYKHTCPSIGRIQLSQVGEPDMPKGPEEKSIDHQYYGENEGSVTDQTNRNCGNISDTGEVNSSLARQYEEYLAKCQKYGSSENHKSDQFEECVSDTVIEKQYAVKMKRKFEENKESEDSLEDTNSNMGNNFKEHLPKRLKFDDSGVDEVKWQSGNKAPSGKSKKLENVISTLTKIRESSVPKDVPNAEIGKDSEYQIKESDTSVKKMSRKGRKPSVNLYVQTAARAAPLLTDADDSTDDFDEDGEEDEIYDMEEIEEEMQQVGDIAKVNKETKENLEAMPDARDIPFDFKPSALNSDAITQAAFSTDPVKLAQSGLGTQLLTPMEIYSNLLIQMEATGELKEPSLGTVGKEETPKPSGLGDNASRPDDKPGGTVERVKRFACSECNKEYATSSSLRKHMYSHSEEKPHKCKFCNKGFTESSSLKSHEYIHTGEKPLKCHFCEQGFRSPSNLRRHFRVHTGEKPFKCEVCGKEFSQTVRLQSHMLLHTGETPYKCKYCSKGFRTPNQLNSHHRTHTGERPFKCSMCDKTFSDSSNLRTHVRRHIGDKPHECEVCHVLFGFISDLKRHMLTHTKTKPFICPHCNKGFTQSYTLNAHIAIHTGEGLHKCPVCLKNFTTGTNLRRHLLKHPEYLEDHPEIATDVFNSTAGGTRNTVMRIYDAASEDETKTPPANGIITSETNPANDIVMSKIVDSVFADTAELGEGSGAGSGATEGSSMEAPVGIGSGGEVGEAVADFQVMINKLLGQQVFSSVGGAQAGPQDLATIAEVLQDASEADPVRYMPGEPVEPVLPNLPNLNS